MKQKLSLNQKQINNFDEILTSLRSSEHISPYFISYKAEIEFEKVIKVLNDFADRQLININYIIKCSNEDSDMVHEFEFNSDEELFEFYRQNKGYCIECDSELLIKEVRVSYQRKDIEDIGESYG